MSNTIAIKKQDNARPWICAVLLFVISYPKWFWGMSQDVITLASLLLLLFAFDDIVRNKRNWSLGIIALVLEIIFVFIALILPNTNAMGYILVFLRGIGCASIFLCSVHFWKSIVDCFIKLLGVLLIPTIIEHILIIFLDVQTITPYSSECPINPDRDYNIYIFNAYIDRSVFLSSHIRFFSFYDEPGVIGNIMMVLLYIQKFNLKKWYNIVFLISGILSFSLAFYIAVATYYILFGNTKLKIAFVLVVVLASFYFYNNDLVYDLVFGRFEFENGSMSGYNREIHSDEEWFNNTPIKDYFFWGYQPKEKVPYAASWKWAFALYGIIPSLLFLFSIYWSRAKQLSNKRDILLCLVLMTVIWIQRPFIHLYLYAFLISIPFIYLSGSTKKSKFNDTYRIKS